MLTRQSVIALRLAAPALLFLSSLAAATGSGAATGLATAAQLDQTHQGQTDSERIGPELANPDQRITEQAAPEQVGPAQTGLEPISTEHYTAEQADPEQADPEQTDPEQADPEQADPEQADPEQADPEQTDPEQADPEHAAPEQADPEQTDLEPVSPNQTALTMQRYLEMVSQLESAGGVYQADLSETLVGLGMAYLDQANYPEAELAFRRALHNSRVNDGLYNPHQLPILDRLIDINTLTGDWEDLEQNYHYLYWVSKRNFGDNDPRLLPVIDRLGRWHLYAIDAAPDGMPFEHLASADALYKKAIGIIETELSENDPQMINALYAIAMINYRLATLVSDASKADQIRVSDKNSPFYTDTRQLLERARLGSDLMLAGYIKGKTAMERVVAIRSANPQYSAEEHALALVHLADWYLLFSKLNSSRETYSQAYAVLVDQGLPREEVDKLFAHPRSLPAFHLPEYEPGQDQDREQDWGQDQGEQRDQEMLPTEYSGQQYAAIPYVLYSFDVSGNGVPGNIRVVESNLPDDVAFQRRAKRTISTSRFRPRIANGVPVEATDIKLRFIQPQEPATEE